MGKDIDWEIFYEFIQVSNDIFSSDINRTLQFLKPLMFVNPLNREKIFLGSKPVESSIIKLSTLMVTGFMAI